ncbi:hypothetical protein Tco_0270281 [Tanacetum coccineum]
MVARWAAPCLSSRCEGCLLSGCRLRANGTRSDMDLRRMQVVRTHIAFLKRDFKYLYPSDFEDMYLLNLQGHLNHLSLEDKKIHTTVVNLWTKNLVMLTTALERFLGWVLRATDLVKLTKTSLGAKGFEYKNDFTGLQCQGIQGQQEESGLRYTVFSERKTLYRSKEFMFAIQKNDLRQERYHSEIWRSLLVEGQEKETTNC